MHHRAMSRRRLLSTALATLGAFSVRRRRVALAAPTEIKLPDNSPVETFDFERKGIEGWTTVAGQWAVEDMAGAPSGEKALVQRATKNEFNVIVAPPGPYTDVDVSMKFKPISGREDASGGIVSASTTASITSSAPTPSRATSGCTTTIADDGSSRVRA